MRPPIRVLPKDLADKIAAGEVVERPGSVIKELVENSLDAGAKQIRVEIEDGGRKRITVLDDGCGIAPDELPVALERHATSKISELDDLWNIKTMGFRGEALPSIATVSRFTLESRRENSVGRRLYLEGGKLISDGSAEVTSPLAANTTGTLISVEDLFFNVPARLKFLKSKASEAAFIRELIERIALCNPKIGFTLISDGRKLLVLDKSSDSDRVAHVLDVTSGDLEGIESRFEHIEIRGWLDRNGRAANSRHVYLAVNGRMVRDKLLQQAVLVALRPRMMEGEYPRLFLSVEVPPTDVDVNVHPAKSEVRFRRARDVFQVVHGALERLARQPSQAYYAAALSEVRFEKPSQPIVADETPPQFFSNDRVSYKTKDFSSGNAIPTHSTQTPVATAGETISAFQAGPSPISPQFKPGFARLQYIGQLKNTYLLFQDADGLVLIDQHAAHERINYERIKSEFLRNGLKAQPLLISAVVKCKPDDIDLAIERGEAFSRLGFEFEAFGDSCLILRSAPETVAVDRATELFKALLDELRGSELGEIIASDPSKLSPLVERILSTSACHSSVRAGQALSPREVRELVEQLDTTPSSLNCPHGRPASLQLKFDQIEDMFKR